MPDCYQASEHLYHLLSGEEVTPMQIKHEGISHWYLRWRIGDKTFYLDPTSTQFETPVPYEQGTGRGFMTKNRSKGTVKMLIEATKNE
jgi:hypothetical protein